MNMSIPIHTRHSVITFPVLTRVLAGCITANSALTANAVWAQPYPHKPVRTIVPQAVGSPGAYWARQIAAKFPEVVGQNLIVDNRPGANGFIGAEAAALAPADGYTLLMKNAITHVYNPWLFRKMPYRDVEDFAPVTLVSGGPLMLAVNPKSSVASNACSNSETRLRVLFRATPLGYAVRASAAAYSIAHAAARLLTIDQLRSPGFEVSKSAQHAVALSAVAYRCARTRFKGDMT